MPRFIIEYSDNVSEPVNQELFSHIHNYLVSTGHFNIMDIKSRAVNHSDYYLMDGDPNNAFITVHLRIMEGRTEAIRKQLANEVGQILEDWFAPSLSQLNCNLTVFVTEIEKVAYFKSSS